MQNSTLYQSPTPKATLLIVHGMAEHQGRYREFAEFLAGNGIVVMTFDHLGHGKTALENHSLGYMGNPNPHELMLDNVMTYARQLTDSHSNLPHFILGHSMGSFITRCIIGRFGDEFDGAILMGTSSPNPLNKAFVALTRLMNNAYPHWPNRTFDKILNRINNAPFRKQPNLHGFNWLNSNPEQVKAYIADPLCGFPFTNNGFFSLMSLLDEGTSHNWWQNVPTNLPMLFVSGEDDPIGQMGKSIPRIVNDLQKHGFTDITATQYHKMRHEILLETDKQQVFNDTLYWLNIHS